jgi:HK97 family phage prohead protease
MENKKNGNSPETRLLAVGNIKAVGDEVYLEGVANKNVVDRGKEIIAPDAWDLDNYKKNPVILFNHGIDPQLGSTPIGKAVGIEAREDGLYVKAKLSSVDDPVINRIRGLVKERMLKAFSVGFAAMDTDFDAKQGVRVIKKAELYEISVVGVPMNQDSLFEMSEKSMMSCKTLVSKTMDELKLDCFHAKGAIVAAHLHEVMHERIEAGASKEDLIMAIQDISDVDMEMIEEILAGNVTPVPMAFIAAAAQVLDIDEEELHDMVKRELEALEAEAAQAEQSAEERELAEMLEVEPGEARTETDRKRKEFQDCVASKIPVLLDEGMDQDQAIAVAIATCRDEKSHRGKLRRSALERFIEISQDYKKYKERQKAKAEKEKDKMSQLQKKKDSECEPCKKLKQAEQDQVESDSSTAIAAANMESEDNNFGNPMIDQQKQTNVLLGTLIATMQKISDILEKGYEPKEMDDEDDDEIEDSEIMAVAKEDAKEDPELKKQITEYNQRLDAYTKRLENVKQRLEKLAL